MRLILFAAPWARTARRDGARPDQLGGAEGDGGEGPAILQAHGV